MDPVQLQLPWHAMTLTLLVLPASLVICIVIALRVPTRYAGMLINASIGIALITMVLPTSCGTPDGAIWRQLRADESGGFTSTGDGSDETGSSNPQTGNTQTGSTNTSGGGVPGPVTSSGSTGTGSTSGSTSTTTTNTSLQVDSLSLLGFRTPLNGGFTSGTPAFSFTTMRTGTTTAVVEITKQGSNYYRRVSITASGNQVSWPFGAWRETIIGTPNPDHAIEIGAPLDAGTYGARIHYLYENGPLTSNVYKNITFTVLP
jgi:hypothetical protein